jgi:hypothetical protein
MIVDSERAILQAFGEKAGKTDGVGGRNGSPQVPLASEVSPPFTAGPASRHYRVDYWPVGRFPPQAAG